MDSGSLSRQNSAGSMTTMTTNQMSNKTSRTNLSEASADTGIMGDIDNKVCRVFWRKKVFDSRFFLFSRRISTTDNFPNQPKDQANLDNLKASHLLAPEVVAVRGQNWTRFSEKMGTFFQKLSFKSTNFFSLSLLSYSKPLFFVHRWPITMGLWNIWTFERFIS